MCEDKDEITFSEEKHRWALRHGSQYLNLGLGQGYEMVELYVTERLREELPGFIPDFEGNSKQVTMSIVSPQPSYRGLEIAQNLINRGYKPRIRFMDDDTTAEVIVIELYLGRYDVFMPLPRWRQK